jgi:hypothetical protein
MANSTTEYWDVNGVSLQTYAQNIESWGGSREGVPPLRGEDQVIPYARGSRRVRKVPDSRMLSLQGWVLGMEEYETVLRRNEATNTAPASTTKFSSSPGTGGVAASSVVTNESTPFGVFPFVRATWSTASTGGGSAGQFYTETVNGPSGAVKSLSIWVRSNVTKNASMLFRFRNGSNIVGSIQTAYQDLQPGVWTEFRIPGLVATTDYTSWQAYTLVNNASIMAVGDQLDMLAVTVEPGAVSGGVIAVGLVPDTTTTATKWDAGFFSTSRVVFFNYRSTSQAARNNWRALRKLLWNPRKQISLTRRWYDANGVLQTATALAEFRGGLEPDVEAGGHRMKFTVDLFLADPFFYGAEITETLTRTTQTKTIVGDWSSVKARIELAGSQGPTTLTVNGENAHGVTYGTTVAGGATAILDIENFTAKDGVNGKTGNVTHSGHKFWFEPEPGSQSISVSGTGTGTVKYIYQPAWF